MKHALSHQQTSGKGSLALWEKPAVLPMNMVDNSSSLCNSLLADFFVSGQSGQVCLSLE